MCGLTFPDVISVLSDPCMWIADTGATVDMTPHSVGITNLKDGTKDNRVQFGNGSIEAASKTGTLVGTVCRKRVWN